jgi:Predicted xylanase/chitin deacetylase
MSKKKKKILIIILICVVVVALFCFGAYKLMNTRDFQLFGKIVSHANTDKKVVALTFDDGPTEKTPEILKTLNDLNVKCTFFLIGQQMEQHMDYTRAIANAGHQIGNHTYFHEHMIFKSYSSVENEIDSTNSLIRQAGYTGNIVFRPPNCKKLIILPLVLQNKGIVTVTWDVEPDSFPDVASSSERMVDYVLSHTRNGSIILLHIMYDSGENAFNAIPGIVNGLREKGYAFVTVNELLGLSGNS